MPGLDDLLAEIMRRTEERWGDGACEGPYARQEITEGMGEILAGIKADAGAIVARAVELIEQEDLARKASDAIEDAAPRAFETLGIRVIADDRQPPGTMTVLSVRFENGDEHRYACPNRVWPATATPEIRRAAVRGDSIAPAHAQIEDLVHGLDYPQRKRLTEILSRIWDDGHDWGSASQLQIPAALGADWDLPPRDPRLCPVLEVARPADSGAQDNRYRADCSPWLVLFGDGEWHPVTVIAWWTDRHGRSVVQVEWHADGSTWSEAYLFDGEKARQYCGE